jgi:hypothetical protein
MRAYAAGDACPDIDEGFELLMDVEHVAMTRGIGPCEFLAGAQTRAGVALVQIADAAKISPTNKVSLFVGKDRIPD